MKEFFDREKVDKFFDILDRMGRIVCDRYKGRDKLNPDSAPCEKDVFIQRTVAKWFPSLTLKILVSEPTGWKNANNNDITIPVYQYISTAKPHFNYGHDDEIIVNYNSASCTKMRSFHFDRWFSKYFKAELISSEEYKKIRDLFFNVS